MVHRSTVYLSHTSINNPASITVQAAAHHHRHHQYLNREGLWGTTDEFATSFLHFPLFSTALWDLPNSRSVHSLMLSSHLFLCPPFLLPRATFKKASACLTHLFSHQSSAGGHVKDQLARSVVGEEFCQCLGCLLRAIELPSKVLIMKSEKRRRGNRKHNEWCYSNV